MGEKVGVGIIGTGGISGVHIRGLTTQCSDIARIVAVADISEERGRRAAQQAGGADYYQDYHDLLARDDIQFVEILTQPALHREIAVAAAQAGKHICIIKPFTVMLRDADEIIQAARQAGVKLFAGQPTRYDPASRTIHEVVRRGDIGEPTRMYTRSFLYLGWLEKPQGWYYDLRQSGGVTVETLVHHMDLMHWILGPASRAYAEAGSFYTQDKPTPLPDDQIAVLYRFQSGAIGVLEGAGSRALGAPSWATEVTGTEGAVWLEEGGRVTVSRTRLSSGSLETIIPGESDTTGGAGPMLRDYLQCVLEDREPPVTGEDGRYAVEMAWGAIASYRSGQPVSLPFDPAHYPDFD
ncbi:oxidoreductase domain protein [Thermobaculum terrenum ATCC BAA-798]|uniref:Oxidoreductase domain protein n=1 Tax=Thermobaculum terrenum (strain ATCC BAA-798 / CCMEE 7001 / YNP1) TaxID=525904 RepID=D1CGG0_THET1|nr:Gfo/Idh/MocA family oxidoreductase [Thermobaculum terrenum]ACZ42831.1 oxidoreductase domain protein [Thermobaculum terrenum ATCC BAA-798]